VAHQVIESQRDGRLPAPNRDREGAGVFYWRLQRSVHGPASHQMRRRRHSTRALTYGAALFPVASTRSRLASASGFSGGRVTRFRLPAPNRDRQGSGRLQRSGLSCSRIQQSGCLLIPCLQRCGIVTDSIQTHYATVLLRGFALGPSAPAPALAPQVAQDPD
jgi:hypothetical protein